MNDKSRVIVKVEYEFEGSRRVCYGEIEKMKLEEFHSEDENFIWMKNNLEITWIDKHSIVSIDELAIKTNLHENTGNGSNSQGQDAII